jgi:ZIP family zinc transporter
MFFQSHKAAGDVAAITGFVLGVAALVVFEKTLPHIHFLLRKKELAHPKKKVALIAGTITLHNIPEGVAIAAAFASSTPLGWLVTSAIALQDIPEGLMISAPLACYGMDLKTSIKFGVFSGVVEFLAAIVGYALLVVAQAVIPAALAFSAGAMAYVVFVELLPDAFAKKEESLVAVSFFGGIIMAFVIAALLGF